LDVTPALLVYICVGMKVVVVPSDPGHSLYPSPPRKKERQSWIMLALYSGVVTPLAKNMTG